MNKTGTNSSTCTTCNKFFGSPNMDGLCSVCFKLAGGIKKMSFDEPKSEEVIVDAIPIVEKVEEVPVKQIQVFL